ncbi:MAG: hypothetical protein EXQ52_11000 [Bryobacterales bacterium]|nr:hypothetical protein [Bryobacterales bacterium]
MKFALSLLAALTLSAAAEPRLIYSKSFPGSKPAWCGITVEKNGASEYKEEPNDDNPLRFQLAEPDAAEMFALAAKLDHFKRPLESGLKVAMMGIKTFRIEDGDGGREVKFNYSEDADARALQEWFERISETEQHYINLERAVKYDKLGVNAAILHLQVTIDRKRLVAPEQFLPLLDRVVRNDSYLNMARSRAAGLAEAFRAQK